MLPHEAVAKCDIRLVEAMDTADVLRKVEAHVRKHAPEVTFVSAGAGMQPSKTPMTAPHAAAVIEALRVAHGAEPLLYPAGFGSLPGYAFTRILGIEAYVTPYGNADEANHAPNENLQLDCFHNGIRTGAALLDRLAHARDSRRCGAP